MPFDYALKAKPITNYSSKDKSISVIIPIVLKDFFNLPEYDRMQKFCNDSIYAVNLVGEKMKKKKLDIDFDKLLLDLEKCNNDFLTLKQNNNSKIGDMI
ncbi:MAG: hypothetical protein PHF46_04450 [Candidatus Gracilibacteria bacterium]|nr:hypothetical protein [Candidatus Gracilibacteria bacterium]MDD3120632.1 hypothetical protein [Candidatus Gracilibacteria bacterium]MDD4530653.1 hypothetical protein [Candidatus Gracilibacteria bacterium]